MSKNSPKDINIEAFNYSLPDDKIAQQPVADRSSSRLLVYKTGKITDGTFSDLGKFCPPESLLVFNNTRVIPARLFFKRETGAVIQVFLLNPVSPFKNVEQALDNTTGTSVWECMVGNAKKWKEGEKLQLLVLLRNETIELTASLERSDPFKVVFEWTGEISFSAIIEAVGNMPLPPYIKRVADDADTEKYQTVFAQHKGAVAAPTAGLHFTKELLLNLKQAGHLSTELTLHVGAGTFKPVETDLVWNHPMHEELFVVHKSSLETLLQNKTRIATGTTSLRTLESLYWCGVNLKNGMESPMLVTQHQAYEAQNTTLSYEEAIQLLLAYMEAHKIDRLIGTSALMIMPGYQIRSVMGLITNFHLPRSTLLLLISALVGDDWKKIYDHALQNNYRFLSYGDSSLLMKG